MNERLHERLVEALGEARVVGDPARLAEYNDDFSEADPVTPALAVLPTTVEQVQAVVRLCAETGTPLTPRVAGTNVAGLAIPVPGAVVVDLRGMDRIVSVNAADMVAVIEPGVTQQQLKDHLEAIGSGLTFGYSLGPRRSSVLANCVLDGLTNRSLKYGAMAQWLAGLEVVLADASLVKTGAWALSDVPFARSPLPDLTGLFVAWQGTTGIVTKAAVHLAPGHPLGERLFLLAYSTHAAFEAMRRLVRTELCDDIGALSWPTGKMMLGVGHPHPVPDEGEPRYFLYVDLSAELPEEMAYKKKVLCRVTAELTREGHGFEPPLDVGTLVRLNPAMDKFASFPTDLDFLTDHPGGGLTWVGTYGPLSRFDDAADAGAAIMVRHGLAPVIVSRAMKGGHFGVLRFLATFDKAARAQVEHVRGMNRDLLADLTERGFVMYKTPAWALRELVAKMDPGFVALLRKTKALLDPQGIFNPGKLLLP
ncbi:MAG: FAD-binding oxidoreductase [Deltaproteobacteria bacterium]|nr:FAD-binding oxidoreductase [Deltaproteobacteria bacterium]